MIISYLWYYKIKRSMTSTCYTKPLENWQSKGKRCKPKLK